MKNSSELYRGSATPDDVRDAVTELLRNYEAAAQIMPVSWIASAITDLVAATAFDNAGRRGDAMRTFMRDLHADLELAHDNLQRAIAAGDEREAKARRIALVG